jgi:hypothetical protein
MLLMRHLVFIGILIAFMAGIAPQAAADDGPDLCQTDQVRIDDQFASGALFECQIKGRLISAIIAPEDEPINPSPWYSVRITTKKAGDYALTLIYKGAKHRYDPKILKTGASGWASIDPALVTVAPDETKVSIKLKLGIETVVVSAQEIMNSDSYNRWGENLIKAQPRLSLSQIGQSIKSRPINLYSHKPEGILHPKSVFFVGRQHPPELTGAFMMRAFMERIFEDQPLSNAFRARFAIHFAPNLNPDGVEAGHWRHNLGSKDLNRDWGPFTQPETKAVDNWLKSQTDPMVLFLDFHSTGKNVFYTQTDAKDPKGFVRSWLEAAGPKVPSYRFTREPNDGLTQANSKNHMHGRYSIPTITFETDDKEDRAVIIEAGRVFADEMMRLLLAEEEARPSQP